ncbi:hypothetical protein INR49_007124 [Caranx melampygus]|nr:hypothetical protein INR49_007124 [Caranx melampygus]
MLSPKVTPSRVSPSSASLASSVPNDSPIVAMNNSPGHHHLPLRTPAPMAGEDSPYTAGPTECVFVLICEAQSHQGHDTVPVEDEWMEARGVGGAGDGGQRRPVLLSGVSHRALAGGADRGLGDEPEGGGTSG